MSRWALLPIGGAPGVADGGGRATRDLYQFIAKMVEEQWLHLTMKFFFFWWRESTGGIFPGGRMSKLSADEECCPPPPQTPIPHFYWSKGGYSQLNPDPNIWFTEVVTGGYWGLLWLENYVVWIVLEPWLNTFRCMPLTCKVLINFKWAIGGHLHHNVTFVFVPKWIMAVDYYAQVI